MPPTISMLTDNHAHQRSEEQAGTSQFCSLTWRRGRFRASTERQTLALRSLPVPRALAHSRCFVGLGRCGNGSGLLPYAPGLLRGSRQASGPGDRARGIPLGPWPRCFRYGALPRDCRGPHGLSVFLPRSLIGMDHLFRGTPAIGWRDLGPPPCRREGSRQKKLESCSG